MKLVAEDAGVHYDIFIPEHLFIKLLCLAHAKGITSKEYLTAMIDAAVQIDWELRD